MKQYWKVHTKVKYVYQYSGLYTKLVLRRYHFEIVECYEAFWCGEQGLKTLNNAIFKTMVVHITLVWN